MKDLPDPESKGESPIATSAATTTDKPTPTNRRYYALYQIGTKFSQLQPSNFIADDEPAHVLSVLASSLNGSDEIALREFLTRRINRGAAVKNGTGIVSSISLENPDETKTTLSVYYCVVAPEWVRRQEEEEEEENGGETKGFLISFVSSVPQELELFKSELDAYADRLTEVLDKNLEGLETVVTERVQNWRRSCVEYVARALALSTETLPYLLHCAMLGVPVRFVGFAPEDEEDVAKLVKACSLENLLQISKPVQSEVTIRFGDPRVDFPEEKLTFFCRYWSQTILSGFNAEEETKNPVAVRKIVEDFKLKVVQDINCMKRLLQRAENDFYAIFKAFTFLKHTGNVAILVQYLKAEGDCKEDGKIGGDGSVMELIEDFLNATGS